MAEVGERIGTYEVLRLIARGGMATVFEARQAALDRAVALKRLDVRMDDPSMVQRFIRESRIAASFEHPNIVTVFDFFESDGVPYIAMEYLPRGSLRPWIGRLEPPQVFGVLEGILAALEHAAARGVAHRDLKPENVLVTHGGSVKIADFGIAKAYTHVTTHFTAEGAAIGTPAYMAPEQVLGRPVGAYTDLYALGVMAYELLSGAPPFHAHGAPMSVMYRHVRETPEPLTGVDPRLARWVSRLLEKAPDARPAGAAEAWAELEETVVDLLGPYWRRHAALHEPAHEAATTRAVDRPSAETDARAGAPAGTDARAAAGDDARSGAPAGAGVRSGAPAGAGAGALETTVAADRPAAAAPARRRAPRRRLVAGLAALCVAGAAAVAIAVLDGGGPSGGPTGSPGKPRAAAPYDFDGDGRPALVAGLPGDAGGGAVLLVAERRRLRADPRGRGAFGSALASGDFDHDGYADLAIGAPGHDAGDRSQREGAVAVRYGSADGLGDRSASLPGPGTTLPYRSARFGAALAAGDLDGDGYADLAVGAPGANALVDEARGSGAVRLLFGGPDGLTTRRARTLRRPRSSLARFGSLLALGDVNRDGRPDLAEAAPGSAGGARGHASICLGGRAGPTACRVTSDGLDAGPAALAVGDVTGDGFDDVVHGVPAAAAGLLRLWRGTRTGLSADGITITQKLSDVPGNDQLGDRFGSAVAVGDLDRDGFADMVVGAPGEDSGAGRVTVIRGGRSGHAGGVPHAYSQDTAGVRGPKHAGHEFGAALALLDQGGNRSPELTVSIPGERLLVTLRGVRGGFTGSGAKAFPVGREVRLGGA